MIPGQPYFHVLMLRCGFLNAILLGNRMCNLDVNMNKLLFLATRQDIALCLLHKDNSHLGEGDESWSIAS